MARDSQANLRNSIIYEVYVRNHSEEGNFQGVARDLDRIKALGTDIVWFMPIHSIGVKNKKGTLGCPYAIKNYREVNKEYGTLEDFKNLIEEIHKQGMKVMIDVVFNHTSPDSFLKENNPEYFYKKPDGSFGNRVGDWSDIIDLDYNNKELWKEQIDTLKFWASLGLDGFRCDVAPMVPIDFWVEARDEIAKINKDFVWLAESVQPHFILYLRKNGILAHSDGELYNAFDITYDYDVQDYFLGYLKGENTLKEYIEKLRNQESNYPANYLKLRFLENHDQPRAKKIIKDEELLNIWTAFLYFNKGVTLLYAGQEAKEENTPSLFDIDKVNWNNLDKDFQQYLKNLAKIKKMDIITKGIYEIEPIKDKEVIVAKYEDDHKALYGVFNVGKEEGSININIKDGVYKNLINNEEIQVTQGAVELKQKPCIIQVDI